MKTFRELTEASVHPMAVHAYPSGKNQFTVHAVGSKVKHVSVGDKVSSSDLDDLTDAGHRVKEVKKPVSEEVEQVDEISKKAVNAYLDRSDEISDADRPGDKAKKPNRERGNKLAYDKLTGDAKIGATLGKGKTRIGPGGKAIKNEEVDLDESGLSTKTLANYSLKASTATTDKSLPAKKTSNRYAGVYKVDKILSLRDKKKVD
jgi:hypothetical protein